MRALIRNLFGGSAPKKSGNEAKQRLKVLLVHDEVALSPAQMDLMKEEIMEVILRYVDVDPDGVEFKLDKSEGSIALVSNVPVKRSVA